MAFSPITVRDGNGAAQTVSALKDPSGNFVPSRTFDNNRATYRFAASFTPYATAAITVLAIKGSATKTVRIKRITVGGTSTTNPGSSLYALQRVSAAGTGGTAVTPTAAKLDFNNSVIPAATAVVTHYTTAAQSAGTATNMGGPLWYGTIGTSIVTAPTTGPVTRTVVFPDESSQPGQSIVLRGTGDIVEIQNKNGGNLPAGTILEYGIELEEDDS